VLGPDLRRRAHDDGVVVRRSRLSSASATCRSARRRPKSTGAHPRSASAAIASQIRLASALRPPLSAPGSGRSRREASNLPLLRVAHVRDAKRLLP
jgi:hypothetical protein